MSGWDYTELSPPLDDTRVDNIASQVGVIDRLPPLRTDLSDDEMVKNIQMRVQDSVTYYNNPDGFNLNEARQENKRLVIGKQVDVSKLYRFQVPYVENEIFVAQETMIAYLTAQQPQPEVYPAQDGIQSKKFAIDLEKALTAHSQKFQLQKLLDQSLRNLFTQRVAYLKLYYDQKHGKGGEIVPEVIDSDLVIIDKNAKQDHNPEWICHIQKWSFDELIYRFPDKEDDIRKVLGVGAADQHQDTNMVVVREFWFTHYTHGKPEEAVCWITESLVLDCIENPNWLYHGKNFLDCPIKPFIPLNYINDGNHWIDQTTPVEQAAVLQQLLNKRGRQIMENADKANGLLVVSTGSGLTKDDLMNITGDPNQKVLIKSNGQPIGDLVYNVPGHDLPSYVMDDKIDQRNTLFNIFGMPPAPGQDQNDKTLGQALMMKNQANGRQDLITRAIDNFMYKYFNLLVQMMLVWYTDKHFFVYNGGDGNFDYITIHRNLFEDGMAVSVKSGTSLPFDKSRQEAVALQLAKMDMIDPYNLYRDLHMDNIQKRYDAWFKWKTAPQELARDAEDEEAETEAFVQFVEIMGGKKAKVTEDATKEHILSHRKQMLSDKFIKGKPSDQKAFIEHIEKELQSLELRTSLDLMSNQNPELLEPTNPITPLDQLQQMQPQQPPMPGQPPAGPPGQPPMQPPMGPQMGTPPAPPTPLGNTNPEAGVGMMNPGSSNGQPPNPSLLSSI